MKRITILLLPALLLTGCSSESLADRIYTRGIGLSSHEQLAFTMQAFEEEGCRTVTASGIPEAIRMQEVQAGGRVFVGHTELVCLDGTTALESAETLFYEQCLSPGCKVLYTAPEAFFGNHDSAEAVHSLRMAERNGMLPATDLSTVLEEWLGAWETALLPTPGKDGARLVFLHQNGTSRTLSEEAAAGMYWLRRNKGNFSVSLGDEEIRISQLRLTRTAKEQAVHYAVHVRTRDCSAKLLRSLEEMIQTECYAAVSEMLKAHADVIGMQEALEAAGSRVDTENPPEITVSVTAE